LERLKSAAIAEVIRRSAELKALVPGIDDFEWGENSSPEGLIMTQPRFPAHFRQRSGA
jgi:hypothetical protein